MERTGENDPELAGHYGRTEIRNRNELLGGPESLNSCGHTVTVLPVAMYSSFLPMASLST